MGYHKKIDYFFNGKYIGSTNSYKTCKDARNSYLNYISNSNLSVKFWDTILLNPKKLKCFYSR